MKILAKNTGEQHNFWQNYTDLMSGLMLIFLIASVGYVVSQDDSRKIKAIINAQKELANQSQYFTYNEQFNRFECIIDVEFAAYSLVHDIDVASQIPYKAETDLIKAGKELRKFIDTQKNKYEGIDFEILIDGRAAGHYQSGTLVPQISYRRAFSLYDLWYRNGLFDNTKDNIHPAGSGYGGVGRYPDFDDRNRTFIISIIPFIKK